MKQDRFLTGILAGILILIVLALVMFFARKGQGGYVADGTPEAALHNYVTALEKQDYQRAYEYVADGSTSPSYNAFLTTQTANLANNNAAGLEVGTAQIDGDTAIVPVTVVRVSGGPLADTYREPQTVILVRQGGAWKITSMGYPYWDWSWSPQNNPPPKPAP